MGLRYWDAATQILAIMYYGTGINLSSGQLWVRRHRGISKKVDRTYIIYTEAQGIRRHLV